VEKVQDFGVPHAILQVCIILLYENVFQNPELFPTQVSLSPEQSTLPDSHYATGITVFPKDNQH
jgi:hypothetical protein